MTSRIATVAQLGDKCERATVGHVGPMADRYQSSGIPFLRSQDIKPFCIDTSAIKYIDGEFDAELRKSRLRTNDVVVVRTGYPGTAAVVPPSLNGANCADLVILTPGPELDPWFTAAALNSTWGQGAVAGNLVGVAQQHFNVGAAKALQIRLPPLSVQQRIGGIVRAYCALIDVNTRRIAILEEAADRLFDEWFVKERSGGGGDWRTVSLGEVCENHDRFRRPLSKIQRQSRHGPYPYYGAAKVFDYIDDYLFEGRFLLLAEDGSVVTPNGHPVLQLTQGRFWANNHTHILRGANGISTEYLYLALRKYPIAGHITGAAQPKITQANLNRIPIRIGPETVRHDFDEIVQPMFDLIDNFSLSLSNLRKQRDLLLPKLISGEIDVSWAEAIREAAE